MWRLEQRWRLYVEQPIRARRVLAHEDRHGDVINRHARDRLSVRRAVMRVTMDHKVGPMAVDHFGQPRASQVRIDFRRLADYRIDHRSVMQYDDAFRCAQQRERALELHGFVDGGLDERLDL